MEAGIIAIIFCVLTAGIIVGMFIGRSITNEAESQGIIYVYCDGQGDNPSLLLEYAVPIDDIISRKRVIFDVNVIR